MSLRNSQKMARVDWLLNAPSNIHSIGINKDVVHKNQSFRDKNVKYFLQ